MSERIGDADWSSLSYEEKNEVLFQSQKRTLDQFLERGAISHEQHDKSLHDLTEKSAMKISEKTAR